MHFFNDEFCIKNDEFAFKMTTFGTVFIAKVRGGKAQRGYDHVSHEDINTQAGEVKPKEDL